MGSAGAKLDLQQRKITGHGKGSIRGARLPLFAPYRKRELYGARGFKGAARAYRQVSLGYSLSAGEKRPEPRRRFPVFRGQDDAGNVFVEPMNQERARGADFGKHGVQGPPYPGASLNREPRRFIADNTVFVFKKYGYAFQCKVPSGFNGFSA